MLPAGAISWLNTEVDDGDLKVGDRRIKLKSGDKIELVGTLIVLLDEPDGTFTATTESRYLLLNGSQLAQTLWESIDTRFRIWTGWRFYSSHWMGIKTLLGPDRRGLPAGVVIVLTIDNSAVREPKDAVFALCGAFQALAGSLGQEARPGCTSPPLRPRRCVATAPRPW